MLRPGSDHSPRHSLHISPPAGLIIVLAMAPPHRPEPAGPPDRSPRDEEVVLPALETLTRESAAPQPRSQTAPRRSTYHPLPFWTRFFLRLNPITWADSWRVRRMYRAMRIGQKLAYLKHFEGESAGVSATQGLRMSELAGRARQRR